jgi:hypothetical protein
MKYYNTELDVNKNDDVLRDLVNKSIEQSLKNLADLSFTYPIDRLISNPIALQ